jgi:CBS domain-containing protein
VKAADVMVKEIISVRPDASVQEAARVLLANRISAVLVLDEKGEALGILSKGDLLRRAELGTERLSTWRVADLTASARQILAEEFVKSHSLKVADVMTRSVITADPDMSLGEIARLFEKNHIKRVPVVDDDKVIGIISRADILQALVSIYDEDAVSSAPEDDTLRERLVARLNVQPWMRRGSVNVVVRGGVVDLYGIVDSAAERNAVRVAAEITPGVRSVNDHLAVSAENG